MAQEISKKTIRRALRAWHSLSNLGRHPYATLRIVEARRLQAGYPPTPEGQGRALRDELLAALEALRPEAGPPDPHDRRWRAYVILEQQFIYGSSPDTLSQSLLVSRRTFFDEQDRALQALAEKLRQLEGSASSHSGASRPARAADRRQGQPRTRAARGQRLLGRSELIASLLDRLCDVNDPARAVVLTAPRGYGKSALAHALVNQPQVQAVFGDGVLWSTVGPAAVAASPMPSWAGRLGVDERLVTQATRLGEVRAAVKRRLTRQRVVLVLDDVDDPALVNHLAVGGGNCGYIITTRNPALAEQVVQMWRRTHVIAVDVPPLDMDATIALLGRQAPMVMQHDLAADRALAYATGGVPLAVEMLASFLRRRGSGGSESVADLLRAIHAAGDGLPDADGRPLERLERFVVRALTPNAAGVWQAVAAAAGHPATFTLGLLSAIAPPDSDLRAAIAELTMLRLIVQFADGRFARRRGSLTDGAPANQAQTGADLGVYLVQAEWPSTITQLGEWLPHLHRALDWSREREQKQRYAQLALAFATTWRSLLAPERALPALEHALADQPAARLAAALALSAGHAAMAAGQPERAHAVLVQLEKSHLAPAAINEHALLLAEATLALGRPAAALDTLEMAVRTLERSPSDVARAIELQAEAYRQQGELTQARLTAELAAARYRTLHQQLALGRTLVLIGRIERDAARWREARRRLERVLQLGLALHQPELEGQALRVLADVEHARGAFADALTLLQQADARFAAAEDAAKRRDIQTAVLRVWFDAGMTSTALRLAAHEASGAVAHMSEVPWWLASARIHRAEGQLSVALSLAEWAAAAAHTPRLAGAAWFEIGEIRLALGQVEMAQDAWRQAEQALGDAWVPVWRLEIAAALQATTASEATAAAAAAGSAELAPALLATRWSALQAPAATFARVLSVMTHDPSLSTALVDAAREAIVACAAVQPDETWRERYLARPEIARLMAWNVP